MNGDNSSSARGMDNSADFIQLPPNSPLPDSGRHGNISRDFHVRSDRFTSTTTARSDTMQSSHSNRGDRRDRDRDREWQDRDRDRDRDRRRRSRSPRRSSRRDFDNDAYSSSRDYREREREDRHRGGDRDGWERDRGSRRDRRDEDRPRRGDRDPFEDRRRREREERRESSPARNREPTPDLTNIVPINQRKRRMTQWDVKPVGYELVTAEAAKLSGMFPLPGAPRAQAIDQSRLQALLQQPGGAPTVSSLVPVNSRVARRLIITHLPVSVTEQALTDFINLQLNELVPQPDPCVSTSIPTSNSGWALATFRSPEDTTLALHVANAGSWTMPEHATSSNGTMNGGPAALAFRRPKNYIQPTGAEDDADAAAKAVGIRDSASKIVVTHIPDYIDDGQAKELIQVYGDLKAFNLLRYKSSGDSTVRCLPPFLCESRANFHQGVAFCEYEDPIKGDAAIIALNTVQLGNDTLKAERACVGITQLNAEMNVQALNVLSRAPVPDGDRGRVIQLLNMVSGDELMDNDEYEGTSPQDVTHGVTDTDFLEIYEDVRREVSKYGSVVEVKIPRPAGARTSPGVGKIFIKFETSDTAARALKALGGRKFSDRTVVSAYYDEVCFDSPCY